MVADVEQGRISLLSAMKKGAVRLMNNRQSLASQSIMDLSVYVWSMVKPVTRSVRTGADQESRDPSIVLRM